jgi:uncharacterized DUF497 family protein
LWKHAVSQREVIEVFWNKPRFRWVEKGHHRGEDVYYAAGQTDGGRYLSIFFVHKEDGHALVVSARDMTEAERKRYEKK